MNKVISYGQGMNNFQPLSNIICFDDFDNGLCGWVNLMPNYILEDFRPHDTQIGESMHAKGVEQTQWGPIMLSTATFRYPGTHGSMNGIYSLKLSTRPEANEYEKPPAPGGISHAIKRLTQRKQGLLQLEMWYAYTTEQDRWGMSEKDIRAFGVCFDLQDAKSRNFVGVRYLNSVNAKSKKAWQYMQSADVSDKEWAYGIEGNWHKKGVDPFWYGKRYSDGSTDGFKFIPQSKQELCYNESDDKINWMYLRFLYDTEKKEYVEMQSRDRVFDLRGIKATDADPYAGIEGLLNPVIWVETDTNRRVFLYIDSIVISTE